MSARVRVRRAAGRALAVLTLLLAAGLIWSAVDLYAAGRALRQTEPAAVIYRPEAVSARLEFLLPVLFLWLAALATALAAGAGRKRPAPDRKAPQTGESAASPRVRVLRAVLLGLALVLLLLGVLGGGLREVLLKAANLCTECIGLG